MDRMALSVLTENELSLPFYLIAVGHWDNQESIIRPNGLPCYQWLQCSSGKGELLIDGKSYSIEAGQGFFLYPNKGHEYHSVVEPWGIDWICFNGLQVESFLKLSGVEESTIYSIINYEIIEAHLMNMLFIAQSNNIMKGYECSKNIYSLLIDLMNYTTSNSLSMHQQYSKLKPVLDYMDIHYHKFISLEDLADTINITPQHLCLLFKSILKIRPFEYLNRLRINKSKELMFKTRGKKITEISKLVGFDSPSYFCLVFKKTEGITPEGFKKLHSIY